MAHLEADLVQKEVDPPVNGWCSCGHKAPPTYKRSGPDSPSEPTRFFLVTAKDGLSKIYCEPCLVIAHWMAQQKKRGLVKI